MTERIKHKRLHMIGNAHVDPVWLWRWPEGLHEVRASFRSALDRMKETGSFVFVASSAAFYEWIERVDPAMFAEIQQRVAEGRWEIAGGWWIEPDCNLPSGESFVRQGLYGQRYFEQKFGRIARTGFNVDSFGHHAMLPQILAKSGLGCYLFLRPAPEEKGLPGPLFWWQSDDGSRVLACRIPYEYSSGPDELGRHVLRCAAEIKPPFTAHVCLYGIGDHGGGPSRANIRSIERLNADPAYPALEFSTPDRFFDEILGQELPIPTVHRDLQHHASGTYAAHSGVKRWNRQAENLLTSAEKYAALACWAAGQPYPRAGLTQGWKNVLFNQFHDILAGTSIEEAYQDARDMYGEASAAALRALNDALQAVMWKIRVPEQEGSTPLVVFNPHGWQSKVNVEIETGPLGEHVSLLDEHGQEIALQFIQTRATTRRRQRITFTADLPPLGYRTYRAVPRPGGPAIRPACQASEWLLENDRLRLEFDSGHGTIKSLRDKRSGIEVFSGPAAVPAVVADPSDTWGHSVFRFDEVLGAFEPAYMKLVEHGPVKSVVRVDSRYQHSRLVQDFVMYRELDRIDVHVTVDWHEQFRLLKLRFPVNLIFVRATYEIPYGHLERATDGEEEPCQSWLDVSGCIRETNELYGLSLINDGKYSCDVRLSEIGLTVLRSPIYAHHVPAPVDPGREYSFIDQGMQRFTYSLLPHEGGWEAANVFRHALELNAPPTAMLHTFNDQGSWPMAQPFVSVEPENLVVGALKLAEDGEDLILRVYEVCQAATEALITLPFCNRTIGARFGPCEIKTFRIPRDNSLPAVETDLLERGPHHEKPRHREIQAAS